MPREAPITYKLPAAFQQKHKQLLEGWDWSVRQQMPLAETLPDEADLADVVLVLEPGRGRFRGARADAMVVVANDAAAQLVLRRYSDSLDGALPPEAESQ